MANLRANLLPDPPALTTGMTVAEYKKAVTAFEGKLNDYYTAMEAESVAQTDEVGYSKSTMRAAPPPSGDFAFASSGMREIDNVLTVSAVMQL